MAKIIPSKISKPQSLRVLMVEDSEDDALLIIRALKKGGYDPEYERVETATAMKKDLQEKQWDIILCDYKMPKFSGLAAIDLFKETNIDIPLIIVSGTIGEDVAVNCMLLGANDYIMKNNLSRLCPAVARELEEVKVRNKQKQTDESLREIKEELQWLFKNMINAFVLFESVFNDEGHFISYRFVYINDAYERITGVKNEEVKGRTVHEVWPETEPEWIKKYGEVAVTGASQTFELYHAPTKKLYHCSVYRPGDKKNHFCVIFEDITEHKRAEEALRNEQIMLARTEAIAHVGSWEWDIATDTVLWSDELFRIFQRDPQEGAPSFAEHPSLYHPDDMARLQQAVEAAVAKGNPYELELRAIRKDGETRVCIARGVAKMEPGGRAVRLFGSMQDITERKRAEDGLRESEERFHTMFRGHDAVMLLIDQKTGAIRDANLSATRFYGYPKEQLCQMTIQEINTLPAEEVAHQRTLAIEEKRNYFIFPHRLASGEVKTVEVHSSPIITNNEAILFSIIHDITDRKQTEEALKESENKYRLLVENINDVIYTLDISGRFTYVSPVIEKFSSYKTGDLIGKNFIDFVYPDDLPGLIENFNRTVHGELEPFEYRILDGDKVRHIRTSSQLILKDGVSAGLTGVMTDITDRKRAEEELKQSEDYFRSLIENSLELITIMREDGTILFESSSSERILGYKPEELVGKNTMEYIHPDDLAKAVATLSPEPTGETQRSIEIRFRCKDGSWLLLEADGRDLRSHPAVKGIVINSRDITYRKKAEEELKQSLESLRRAVGTTIQVMVSAIEARDPYTSGHQLRSANLACAIATEMGLPSDKIEGLQMAGSIHDIGKLSIPAEILSKPTKLTNLEFSLIKEHSRKGYEMLKDVESPWPLAEIVYQHHERMDGSGYPRNLKGDEILMEARIMAVADVVEAMASNRPYRPGLGIDEALTEIEKNKGTFYDDTVADACLRLFREKGFQLEIT